MPPVRTPPTKKREWVDVSLAHPLCPRTPPPHSTPTTTREWVVYCKEVSLVREELTWCVYREGANAARECHDLARQVVASHPIFMGLEGGREEEGCGGGDLLPPPWTAVFGHNLAWQVNAPPLPAPSGLGSYGGHMGLEGLGRGEGSCLSPIDRPNFRRSDASLACLVPDLSGSEEMREGPGGGGGCMVLPPPIDRRDF